MLAHPREAAPDAEHTVIWTRCVTIACVRMCNVDSYFMLSLRAHTHTHTNRYIVYSAEGERIVKITDNGVVDVSMSASTCC